MLMLHASKSTHLLEHAWQRPRQRARRIHLFHHNETRLRFQNRDANTIKTHSNQGHAQGRASNFNGSIHLGKKQHVVKTSCEVAVRWQLE